MTLLERLEVDLPRRQYLSIDVGYEEHVAVVIPLETFVSGDSRWKRATCLHFPSTQAGLCKLQGYLDGFSTDPSQFFGLCEPTGGYYGATVFQYLLDQGYDMNLVENAMTRHMREKIFPGTPKTDEMEARVMARIGYLHEAVGEEFTLRPLELSNPDDADLLVPCSWPTGQLLCRDSWKLNGMITRARPVVTSHRTDRNQFTQLMAVYCSTLQCGHLSRTEDLLHQQRLNGGAGQSGGGISDASTASGGTRGGRATSSVGGLLLSARPPRRRAPAIGSGQPCSYPVLRTHRT